MCMSVTSSDASVSVWRRLWHWKARISSISIAQHWIYLMSGFLNERFYDVNGQAGRVQLQRAVQADGQVLLDILLTSFRLSLVA